MEYNDRQAMAYHIYCPLQDPNVPMEAFCKAIDKEFFAMRVRDADRMGSGMIMTEFGAAENIKGTKLNALKLLSNIEFQVTFMQWKL